MMKKNRIFSNIGLTLIAGFVFVSLFFVSTVRAAVSSYPVDFNNTSDLTGKFNSDSTPFFTNTSSGGISNSGAVSISENNQAGDIWTTKQGYDVPGTGEKYTISAFFNDTANSGYGGLGFSNLTANEVDSYGSPAKGIGISFHGSGGYFVNNGTNTEFSWSPDLNYPNIWYKMILEVTAKGSNIYDLKFQIWNSDANGNLGSMITENTLNGVVNADLGGASEMYGYLSAKGGSTTGRFANIDNFLIELEDGAVASTDSISSNSNGTSSAPSCDNAKPVGNPDLFQIDVNDTHATLYYTPLNNSNNDYFISFSEISNTFRYGTLTGQGPSSGVLSYTVNFLQPNTTYYFKVRGQNGCMPGDFGNELKITTRAKGSATLLPYYRYTTNL